MLAEWSAECSHDDPMLVVPWSGSGEDAAAAGPHFVDLREDPYALDQIAEAELHPPLLLALRALNAPRSPVFTAKCDAWQMDDGDLARLQLECDVPATEYPCGFASYLDLIWRERQQFVSFHRHQQMLDRMVRLAETLELPYTMLEATVRPALVDLEGPQEGFAVSLYVKALGADAAAAYSRWGEALAAVAGLMRGKDLGLA